MTNHEKRYKEACQKADDAILRLAIDRLPLFDGSWPEDLATKWFDQFFILFERARARDLQKPAS